MPPIESGSGSESACYRGSTVLIDDSGIANAGPPPGTAPGTKSDPDSDSDWEPTIMGHRPPLSHFFVMFEVGTCPKVDSTRKGVTDRAA